MSHIYHYSLANYIVLRKEYKMRLPWGNVTLDEIKRMSLKEVNEIDSEGCTALMEAVMQNNIGIVRLLLDKGVMDLVLTKVDKNLTVLMVAVSLNHSNIVKLLLAQGAKSIVNVKDPFGITALMYAAKYNHLDMVKLLLANNAQDSIIKNLP